MAGMFWHNNYAQSIQIDALLSEEDITLQKLMDAEDILQECKSQNKRLIEYLIKPEILEELINLITQEPSLDLEERWRYKYSTIACELLTCDVPSITEKLAGNEVLLTKLYSFIDTDEKLNPLLASFFSKTLCALLRRACDQNWYSHQFVCLQFLEFLKSRDGCVNLLLKHIEVSAIMDLILVLLTKIEDDEMRQNVLNWLDEQQLVRKLVSLLSSPEPEKHENVSQLLCDFITSYRQEQEKKPDLVMLSLQSDETINILLSTILCHEHQESSIVGGIRILLVLLGKKEIKSVDKIIDSNETFTNILSNVVEDELRNKIALIIVPYLDKLIHLLLEPPEKPSVKTTVVTLEKPLGLSRLYILKLISKLLSTENSQVRIKCIELNTFKILLDLFFEYSWNNFLHTQVQQCLELAINCESSETSELMYEDIFLKCKLLDRICEAWEENEKNLLNKESGIRQGYIGHLIIIANNIVSYSKENENFSKFLKEKLSEKEFNKWENFASVDLEEVNRMQQIPLGEYSNMSFQNQSDQSEDYASYQEDFNNQEDQAFDYMESDSNFQEDKPQDDDDFENTIIKNSNKGFGDFEQNQELFDKICEEKMFEGITNNISWEDEPFCVWHNGEKQSQHSNSSDEEEKDESNDFCFKEQQSNPWSSSKILSSTNESLNIWNVDVLQPLEQTGWANFDAAFDVPTNESKKIDLSEMPNEKSEDITIKLPVSDNDNKDKDFESKTVESNVPKLDTSVNIADTNANHTYLATKVAECKDTNISLEESSSKESKFSKHLENVEEKLSTLKTEDINEEEW